jgi:hypothetical protein
VSDQQPPGPPQSASDEPKDPWAAPSSPPPGANPPAAQQPPAVPPQAPNYGQPPAYGQQSTATPPVYGQQPPNYDQPPAAQPPVYGQQPPNYGQAPGAAPSEQPYPAQPSYSQAPAYNAQQNFAQPSGQGAKNSSRSVIVLVLGISSLLTFWLCFIGLLPAIAALVLAGGAKREISQSQGALEGEKLVLGGQICAIIGLALTVFAVIGTVALFSNNNDPYALGAISNLMG